MTRNDVIQIIKDKQGDRSMRQLARDLDCSVAYLSDVLKGQRELGPLLLEWLGLRKEKTVMTTYHPQPKNGKSQARRSA